MTVLADAFKPLRRQQASRTVVPISRLRFDVTDRDAFDRCIALVLDWMNERPKGQFSPRTGVNIPSEAWSGKAFDITDEFGANPARAVKLDASDGSVWAARLDYRDPNYQRTWISEFYVRRNASGPVEFGTQLTCVISGDCPPFDYTRPNIIRTIISSLSAEADGRQLSDLADEISKDEIPEFLELLQSPVRRLPIVAISDSIDGKRIIDPNALARMVAGAAHVVHLKPEGAWSLTREVGKRMSTFNGAIRLYRPGIKEEFPDPFAHPLWLFRGTTDDGLLKEIASRVLPAAFLRSEDNDNFVRVSSLRSYNQTFTSPAKDSGGLKADYEALRALHDAIVEERDTWESLALDEQKKKSAAEAEIERLQEDIARLHAKNDALQYRLQAQVSHEPQSPPDEMLESYDDLEVWAQDTLGKHIYIHPAALKDCRKNGHTSMLKRIESALIVVRDYWVPAKLQAGKDRWDLTRQKLKEIGMEDTACFVDYEEAKRTAGYSVVYEGSNRVLYDHIKFGNGYDNANQIRIYYFWDDDRQRFVVGKMPSHLRNNLTT